MRTCPPILSVAIMLVAQLIAARASGQINDLVVPLPAGLSLVSNPGDPLTTAGAVLQDDPPGTLDSVFIIRGKDGKPVSRPRRAVFWRYNPSTASWDVSRLEADQPTWIPNLPFGVGEAGFIFLSEPFVWPLRLLFRIRPTPREILPDRAYFLGRQVAPGPDLLGESGIRPLPNDVVYLWRGQGWEPYFFDVTGTGEWDPGAPQTRLGEGFAITRPGPGGPPPLPNPIPEPVLLPMDPTITVGETVRFTVRFEIDVPPQLFDVRWFRNDQLIPEATGLDYVTPPQQPDNNGDRYHAVVQSPFGPRETKHSTLRVLVPFLIEKHPESLKVVETQTARFCVSVSNPSGFDVSYQWMKGNSPIPGADQACLVIDRVSLSDEGIYRVLVTSEKAGQKILSEPAELQVLRMLRIVRQSESALKVEGQPFQLFVDAVGAGTLSYQWFKDGRPVRGASSRALQFRPLSTHDTGEYVVEVSDSRIRIRSNPIRLTVSRRENREEPGKVPVHEPGTVVIKLRPGPAERLRAAIAQGTDFRQINFPPDVAALNARFGATAVRQAHPKARENQQQLQNIFLLTISQAENVTAASKAYASLGSVAFAEPNPYAKAFAVPNDPHYPLLWGMQTIRADLAWNISTGTGVIVAVVDSGVHQAHCDLAANIWQNPGENGLDGMGNNKASNGVDDDGNGYVDDFAGWDFVSDDNIPQDGNGHGTHVAGTIAAVANNLEGVVGLAYGSKIMALRGLDDNGSGTLLGLLSAVTYAAENGARVINNSWGGSFRSAWGDAVIDYARSLGALVVSAAGNEALQTCSNFPANSENSMAVGAVEPFDVLAYYSNYGVKTDVVAPGGDSFGPPNDILSTLSPGSLLSSGNVVPGGCGSYLYLAGTSMAAPHVSALGALIWQVHPTWNAEEVKQRIRKSVLPLGQAGANGFDSTHGYGRIDAPLAVAPGAPPPIASVSSPANCTTLVAGTGSAPVNVLGEAGGSGFVGYRVDIAPGIDPAPSDFSALGGGTSPVPVGGVLWSNLHQVSLANGTYTLRVVTSNNVGVLSEDRNEIAFRSAYISSPTNDALIRVPSLSILGNVPSSLLRMSSGAWVPDPLVKYTLAWRKPTGSSVIFHTSLTGSTNILGPWTTSAIAEGDTFVELKATYQSGVILQDEVRVVIDRLLRQGFPAVINESFTVKSPAVADLNNDGQKEIVYGASVFRADGSVFPGWDNSPGLGRSNPAIVDAVGNDGKLEIIAAVMSTYIGAQTNMPNCGGPVIYCYPWTGKSAPVWSFQPQNPAGTNVCNNIGVPSTISAADVDGDGKLDVVFTVNYPLQSPAHTTLFVLDAATGVLKAQRDILGYSISSVALANLDAAQDAAAELVMSRQSGGGNNTYVMKFSAGTLVDLPGWPVTGGSETADPVVGDVDQDGKLEILVGDRLWNRDGTLKAGWPLGETLPGTGLLAPLCDLDCKLEGVLGTDFDEAIRTVEDNGAPRSALGLDGEDAFSITLVENIMHSVPIAADVDGDGCADIIRGSPQGFADGRWSRIYSTSTNQFPRFVHAPFYTVRSSPTVEDIDNDGLTDIVIAAAGRLYAWNLGTVHCPKNPWPVFQGNLARTGTLPLTAGSARDLYVEDTPYNWSGPPETGLEPEPMLAGYPFYTSRGIWLRNNCSPGAGNNFRRHQNPEYGQQNCIYVKVCSRGCLPVTNAIVETYYAQASTGLCWPDDWTLVGSASVTNVPAGGYNIVGIPWFPPGTGHYCILARIVSPDDPFTLTNPACIEDYIRFNNNAAMRNVNSIDLLQATTASFEFHVHNLALVPKFATVRLTADGNFFGTGGQAEIDMRVLHHRWQTNGSQGLNVQQLSGTHVKLLNSPAELRDIYLGADEDRVVQITLTVPQPISRAGLAAIFNLEVVQLVDAQIVGGVAYEVSVRGEDTDTDGDGIPDVSDPDDDNDGVPDGSDPNPLISDLPIPNIACATGLPYIFRAGLRDAAAFPTDPVFRGYCLSTAYPDAYWKEFDDIRSSAVFGMSFLGLPPGIAKGEFSFSARPLKTGSEENSIGMAIIPPCATPAFAWASLIGDLPEAGGDWSSNALTRFDLDLRALPPRPNFTSNLLAKLNADHALDLYVQRESLLDWMEMRLWTCPAAVFAHGLPHRAIGQAVLTNGPLGELFITQTTPGGGDGAYTHLGRAEGWSLETGMLDASTLPSGAYLQCMSAGSAGGDGNRLLGLARVEDVGTELGARFDFSVLQSPRYSLLVLSNDVVVAFLTNRIGLAATFPSPLSPTFRDTGGVAGADPASDGFRLSLHLGSLVTIQLPSTGTVTGNELVAWPEMGAERLVLDYRQGVFLTVNSVPSPAITAERAHSLGHEASALGQTTIHPSGAFLLLSNLGTNGTDGVRLHWEDALAGGGITFAELRDHPVQDRWVNTTGSWAQVRSIGELSPGAPQTLSQARITLVSTQSSLPYLVTADGSSMGAATGRISVWSNAVEVAAVTLGSASIEARTSAPWRELRRGASSERLTMEFTPGTLFQVGLQQVLGDALRVDWQGGSAPVAQREFELLSSGLLEMAVGAVCEKGSGGCAPMALEAGYNSDSDVVIHWGGCGYRLQAAESLESPVAWQNLSSSSPVVIPPTMSFRIFRLICE